MTIGVMASHPVCPDLQSLLRTVRDARFADGPQCVRCGSRRVQRWGSFAGRQRYRCGRCRRTYSDLTASPLAYSKRLRSWPEFVACWQRGNSVRLTARLVSVHTTTAFRWRHVLCDALRESEQPRFRGWIEAVSVKFLYSEKGRRRAARWQRTRAEQRRRARVSVVILRDRYGTTAGDIVGGARPLVDELRRVYGSCVIRGSVFLTMDRRFEPLAMTARVLGLRYVRVRYAYARDPLVHLDNAKSHARGLVVWLERFRGVATCYLSNYLAWYRHVENLESGCSGLRLLAWSCAARSQQSARTECDAPADGFPPPAPRAIPASPAWPLPSRAPHPGAPATPQTSSSPPPADRCQ